MTFGSEPRNFTWIIPRELAGMGWPRPGPRDFEFLKDEGIDAIVSLTEHPLDSMIIEEFGFEYKHIPIVDFTAPTMKQVDDFVAFVERMKARHKPVVVHCAAGMGRTGTMLACYLVALGRTADEAVRDVRRLRSGYLETREQERAVAEFARRLSARKGRGPSSHRS